jgi:hypothetical protein
MPPATRQAMAGGWKGKKKERKKEREREREKKITYPRLALVVGNCGECPPDLSDAMRSRTSVAGLISCLLCYPL